MTVNVNGTTATSTDTAISGNAIAKGAYVPVPITLTYASYGDRADGPFNVSFGGVELDFSTVDGSNLITFTVDNLTYYAEYGMTWEEFVYSTYNTNSIFWLGSKVFYDDQLLYDEEGLHKINPTEIITNGKKYTTDNS